MNKKLLCIFFLPDKEHNRQVYFTFLQGMLFLLKVKTWKEIGFSVLKCCFGFVIAVADENDCILFGNY